METLITNTEVNNSSIILDSKFEKLNWKVIPEGCVTSSGIPLEKVAMVREDTKTVLGVHGLGYLPLQNDELYRLLTRVSESTGLEIVNIGLFNGGKKVFIQMKSGGMELTNVGGKKDNVEGYITGVNSFDGSTPIGFGHSHVTISCQNTFFMALKTLEKVKHTKNMFIKIEDFLRCVDSTMKEEKQTFEIIRRMSETPYTVEMEEKVKHLLFKIPTNVDLNSKEVTTTTNNKIIEFEKELHTEVLEKGRTMWGLFSGVTKYTTFSIDEELKMFGDYGNRERSIFTNLSSLVMN